MNSSVFFSFVIEEGRAKSHCYGLLTAMARLDSSCLAMLRRYYCLIENSLATLGDNNVLTTVGNMKPANSWDVLASQLEELRKSTKSCIAKVKTLGSSSSVSDLNSSTSTSSLRSALFSSARRPSISPPPSVLIGDLSLKDVEDRIMLAATAYPQLERIIDGDLPTIRSMASQLKQRMDADKRLLLLVNELKPRSKNTWIVQSPTSDNKRSGNERIKIADLLYRYKKAIGIAIEWIAPGSLDNISSLSESLLSISISSDATSPPHENSPPNEQSKPSETEKSSSSSGSVIVVDKKPPKKPARSYSVSQKPSSDEKILHERRNSCNDATLDQMHAEDISMSDCRPSMIIERFTSLYTDQRMQLLDAMDDLQELNDLEPLKTRLILSVVVLSFRHASMKVKEVREKLMQLAGLTAGKTDEELMAAFEVTLRKNCMKYPLDDVRRDVMKLVFEAVDQFPRLSNLPALHTFVRDCIRLAWCLSVQQPPFVISHTSTEFNHKKHERFYAATAQSETIKSYIWPALCLGSENGPVICKAVVET